VIEMLRVKGKYNWERLAGDCAGGLIAALIALPYGLSMAALMGRNPVLIGGTASATVPFIADAVRAHGIGGAAKVSIVASVFMMAFCVMRLGRYAS
jgi:SulP family sulfate permease